MKLCVVLHLKMTIRVPAIHLYLYYVEFIFGPPVERSPNYQCQALRVFQLMEAGWQVRMGAFHCLCVRVKLVSVMYTTLNRLVASLHVPVKEDLSSLCDGAMNQKSKIYKDSKP
jgi:hypothetical protein